MRVPAKGKGDAKYPLRVVPRNYAFDGEDNFGVPTYERHTKHSWKQLHTYLETLDDMVAELKPIVKKIKVKDTVVVMVCNHGQSQLLINFICSARSRGFDTANILVFATDEETKQLAESMGLAAYYNERVC